MRSRTEPYVRWWQLRWWSEYLIWCSGRTDGRRARHILHLQKWAPVDRQPCMTRTAQIWLHMRAFLFTNQTDNSWSIAVHHISGSPGGGSDRFAVSRHCENRFSIFGTIFAVWVRISLHTSTRLGNLFIYYPTNMWIACIKGGRMLLQSAEKHCGNSTRQLALRFLFWDCR